MLSITKHVASILAGSALVAAVGCSDPTGAELDRATTPAARSAMAVGPRIAATPRARAWHIRAGVATTPAGPIEGCLVYFTSVIEGHATHLGTFQGVGSTCVTAQIAPDSDPPFHPAGPGPYARATFHNPRWTLTAANGDELWLEGYDATAVISLADDSLIGEGRMRVVGGTGRFEGATGTARVGATNHDGVGPDDFFGDGWIRF